MAYTKKVWAFPDSIETQYTYKGNYGARGEKRAPRRKITPEQIKKQNQWRREQEARRVMKANFTKGDLWCTLLYPRGTRKPMEEVKQDMNRFLSKLRYRYKRLEAPLKFLYRIEIGSRGGIHIHMICNETGCSPPTDMMIQTCWENGRVNFVRFGGEEEDYQNLSEYLVKAMSEEQEEQVKEQGREKERRSLTAYSSSRNLIRPKPEKKIYRKWTVRKLIEEGVKPRRGYYVKPDTLICGINPYTGMSYLYYTEVRLKPWEHGRYPDQIRPDPGGGNNDG